MIMEASVEMEKIEPGVVVAQQPVVARDPGEALRRGDRDAFCRAVTADIEQGMRLLDDYYASSK